MKYLIIISFILIGCSESKKSKNNDSQPNQVTDESYFSNGNLGYATAANYNNVYPVHHNTWSSFGAYQDIVQQSSNNSSEVSALGWKLTFEDHFDPKDVAIAKGADPKCFSMPAHCMINWWTREACPEWNTQLSDLNKCHWDVYNYYNYMDYDAKEGQGINAFYPKNVEVKNGHLVLSAERSFHQTFDCKRGFIDPRIGGYTNYTTQCPYFSGGVESKRHKNGNGEFIKGFAQKYGRFEVYAKLPLGQGAWPAHWLLPEEPTEDGCGWPQSGEIDIMEALSWEHEVVIGTFHTGVCSKKNHLSQGFKWKATDQFYPLLSEEDRFKTWVTQFHLYAVEWDENIIRFLVDNVLIGQINRGDKLSEWGVPARIDEARIPNAPFYWILNTTVVTMGSSEYAPNPQTFYRYEHLIDYVKAYRQCTENDVGCVKFTYQNLNAKCSGLSEDVGSYHGKTMCKPFFHFPISRAKCMSQNGVVHQDGDWCLWDENATWKARRIYRECPLFMKHLGEINYRPVCKAFPHFRIRRSKCDGEEWGDYCIWNKGEYYRARKFW